MLVTDEGPQCLYKRNRTGRGLKIMYVGCGYYGGAAHEVGHALWLDHTHNRHDRDHYLDLDERNIRQEYYHISSQFPGVTFQLYREQYRKLSMFENYNYKLPYDYGSIMHYGSSGPNPTMTPKDRNYHRTMGSPLISFTDLAMLWKLRFCSKDDEKTRLESESNLVPIITYSMHTTKRLNVTLRYRYVVPKFRNN
ncbi:astacin [Ancylostoma caninum]|uniref:Metalloendopeptidase n=1 Tax=Ancylostoma caninum TaxID=29170 RepID=A0A368GZT1_ANCCA|nr:astacin [Ancylostoma caninum]